MLEPDDFGVVGVEVENGANAGHRGMYEAAWPVIGKVMGWN